MNMDKLRQEIADDEGVKLNENGQHIIYLDHLALPTCGVGHLIVEGDDEYGQPVFTTPGRDVHGPDGELIDVGVIDHWDNEVDGLKDDQDA